jgi:hypothetical protein
MSPNILPKHKAKAAGATTIGYRNPLSALVMSCLGWLQRPEQRANPIPNVRLLCGGN